MVDPRYAGSSTNYGGTAPTATDDSNKNLAKLEEVLKRQRERLENISGSFGPAQGSSLVTASNPSQYHRPQQQYYDG